MDYFVFFHIFSLSRQLEGEGGLDGGLCGSAELLGAVWVCVCV